MTPLRHVPRHLPHPVPGPSPRVPDGPLARYLTHPSAYTAHLARLLLHVGERCGPPTAATAATAAAALLAGRAWLAARRHAAFADGATLVTILAPPAPAEAGAAVLWKHLSGLLRPLRSRRWGGQPHLAWEYTWDGGAGGSMTVRLWVPGTIPLGMISRAVEAAWPGAHTTTRRAAPPLPPGSLAAGGTLRLARPDILPLGTPEDPDAPLRALASAAAALADGEHAVVQVLARPVTGSRLRRARRAARAQRNGQPPSLSARLLDLITPGTGSEAGRARAARSDPELSAAVRATTAKLAGPHWETVIRYAVATTACAVPEQAGHRQARAAAREHLPGLRSLAHAMASPAELHTGHNWLARRRLRSPGPALASRRMPRAGDLMCVAELASLARLPADPALPGLTRAGARAVPPPPAVCSPGPHARPLGVSDAGAPRPVALAVADGRHHQRVVGPTGTGKTTFIAGQILADAEAGRAAAAVDPKGDMVYDLLARLPEKVADRVVLFDPSDTQVAPPCMNILQGDGTGTDTDMIVDNVTGIFRRIFSANWGPRTDDVFRAGCLTLLGSVPPGSGLVTLADIPPLLSDAAVRRRLTAGVKDPVLRDFWAWYEQLSPPMQAHMTGPLMNKVRALLLRRFPAAALAAGPSTFDMGDLLDRGGIILARLPKGQLGDETAQLLGSFLVARCWQAVSRRARIPEHLRADCGLYVDEAQNFINLPYPFEDMLAEARAYRLSVTMAHQNLAQLPADLRQGISANARSQIIFSVSPEDARDLEQHTAPVLTAHDLSHLGAYQAAARLVAGSAEVPAFTFRTRPLPPPVPGRARLIRDAARAAHGGVRRPAAPDGPGRRGAGSGSRPADPRLAEGA